MRIKSVTIATADERIAQVFKQLGATEREFNGQMVLSIVTTPHIMDEKVDIAYEQLKRFGYNVCSQSMQHFWYIKDQRNKLDTITIESQGKEGFVRERHEYLISW